MVALCSSVICVGLWLSLLVSQARLSVLRTAPKRSHILRASPNNASLTIVPRHVHCAGGVSLGMEEGGVHLHGARKVVRGHHHRECTRYLLPQASHLTTPELAWATCAFVAIGVCHPVALWAPLPCCARPAWLVDAAAAAFPYTDQLMCAPCPHTLPSRVVVPPRVCSVAARAPRFTDLSDTCVYLADVALLTNAFWPSDGEEVAPAEDDEGAGQYRDRENGGGLLDDDDDD